MKKELLISLILMILMTLLISGCNVSETADESTTCEKPYIISGKGCCLDENENNICDNEEINDSPEETECDGNDCNDECNPGCSEEYLGNGLCDFACDVEECGWDLGDCTNDWSYCNPGCPDFFLGDGFCDSDCNVEACNYDEGDC